MVNSASTETTEPSIITIKSGDTSQKQKLIDRRQGCTFDIDHVHIDNLFRLQWCMLIGRSKATDLITISNHDNLKLWHWDKVHGYYMSKHVWWWICIIPDLLINAAMWDLKFKDTFSKILLDDCNFVWLYIRSNAIIIKATLIYAHLLT